MQKPADKRLYDVFETDGWVGFRHVKRIGHGAGAGREVGAQCGAFVVVQGQHVYKAADVAHQRQAAVLQDVSGAAALGAAEQLASAGRDLIGAGNLKTRGRDVAARRARLPPALSAGRPRPCSPASSALLRRR